LSARGVRQSLGSATTDADGRYEFEAPAGPVMVEPQIGADRHEPRSVEGDSTETTQLPDLKVKLLPTVRGRVVGADGNPAAGAFVMHAQPIRRESIRTDRDGRFAFRMEEDDFGVSLVALHPTERLGGGASISWEELQVGAEMQITLEPES